MYNAKTNKYTIGEGLREQQSCAAIRGTVERASGRIAEVRSRSMSCNCMTHTSQQECRGILEWGKGAGL